jgi:predicted aspartyl protease
VSKPVLDVTIATPNRRRGRVKALVDTGSFYTLLREDCIPRGGAIFRFRRPDRLATAGSRGGLRVTGKTILIVDLAGKQIETEALLSPDLRREMILGAGAMQMWDITVRSRNGKTSVIVGRDRRDPEITEVD